MRKLVLFVFNGDPMCFIHVLLNAIDLHARGMGGQIVVEGSATRLVGQMASKDHALHGLWSQVKDAGLVDGVCRACSQKTGALEAARTQGLALLDDMNGHPGMARYRREGFAIVSF